MADKRLLVFHTVAGVCSFTRAAEELNMTQPAVTHQIRQLEEELNTRLFDRTNNRISLTPAGAVVMSHAESILSRYVELKEAVKALTGEASGLVTLGASTTIAEYMLPELLMDFRQRFPDVQIRLRVANTDAIVAMVADNSIDLGVVEGEVSNGLLQVEHCQSDELVVLLPLDHPLAVQSSIAASELLDHPFIMREDGSGTRSVIVAWLAQQQLHEQQLNRPFELGSTEAIKGAVQAGMGISVVSKATVKNELALGLLVARPLRPALVRPFYFVRHRQKFRTHVMQELFGFARDYCEALEAINLQRHDAGRAP